MHGTQRKANAQISSFALCEASTAWRPVGQLVAGEWWIYTVPDMRKAWRLSVSIVFLFHRSILLEALNGDRDSFILSQWRYMSRDISVKVLNVDWHSVGRRIRELRGFNTKQSEFADAIGVAQSYVSDIERGQKEAGAVVLFRIARLYGKTIEWLLTGVEKEHR